VALAAAGRKACLGGPAEGLEGLRGLRPGRRQQLPQKGALYLWRFEYLYEIDVGTLT